MSTIKPLSQLFYEAEIREGAQATAINRFFARFNSLPTAVRKEILEGNVKVSLTTFYDTIYNITTTPTLRFFSTEETRNPKVGITNLATNKLEVSQIFFVDSVRLLHAEIKQSSGGTNITQASEATVAAVQGVEFFDTKLPTNIVNGSFEMQIGGQVVVSNLLMTEFVDSDNPKARPKVKLENVFLADGKPFEITVNLAGSNLKVHDVLRMEVSGVLISKDTLQITVGKVGVPTVDKGFLTIPLELTVKNTTSLSIDTLAEPLTAFIEVSVDTMAGSSQSLISGIVYLVGDKLQPNSIITVPITLRSFQLGDYLLSLGEIKEARLKIVPRLGSKELTDITTKFALKI